MFQMVLRSASGDILVGPGEARTEVGPDTIVLRKMRITATETKPAPEPMKDPAEQEPTENNTESCTLYDGNFKQTVETEASPAAAEITRNTNFVETVAKVVTSDKKSFTAGDKENVLLENFGEMSENKTNTDQNIRSNEEERKKPETKQSVITVSPKNKDIPKIPHKKHSPLEEDKIKIEQMKSTPEKVSRIPNTKLKPAEDKKNITEKIKPLSDKIKPPSDSEKTLKKIEDKKPKTKNSSLKSVKVTNGAKIQKEQVKSEIDEPVLNPLNKEMSKKAESPIMEKVGLNIVEDPKDVVETKTEKLSLAKELFTEIAEEMSINRKSSTSNFPWTEPKEWTEDLQGPGGTEDEFMMVIEDQEPELTALKSRSASKDRAKKVMNNSEGDLRPGSTGYHHLDEFERKLEEMRRELEDDDLGLDGSLDGEVEDNSYGKDELDLIKDELTESSLEGIKNVVESPQPPSPPPVQNVPEHEADQPKAPEAPPRRRSRSRDTTPSRFLSVMTGGFVESKRFGSIVSLVRNRSRSRSRFSESSDLGAGAEVVAEKLRKLTGRKRHVKPVDFEELFARGLAMGDQHEEKKAAEMTGLEAPMIQFSEETGINLPDSHLERGRDKGRKRKKIPPTPPGQLQLRPPSEDTNTRSRSRDYARPEEIRLSPVPKRDLLTGKPLGGCSEEQLFLHKVTNFIAQNQLQLQAKQDESLIRQLEAKQAQSHCDLLTPVSASASGYQNKSTILPNSPGVLPVKLEEKLQPSAGKSFLESSGGQEVFTQARVRLIHLVRK